MRIVDSVPRPVQFQDLPIGATFSCGSGERLLKVSDSYDSNCVDLGCLTPEDGMLTRCGKLVLVTPVPAVLLWGTDKAPGD